mgnify:FL=1
MDYNVKSYTDLEQARCLARILSPETADMHYNNLSVKGVNYVDPFHADLMSYKDAVDTLRDYKKANPLFEVRPCWSTQALLDEIPYQIVNESEEDLTLHIEKEELQYHLRYENECTGDYYEIETETYDDLIDACFEMIVKLKEKDLI